MILFYCGMNRDSSQMSYRRKYNASSLENLFKIRAKRYHPTNLLTPSNQTLPKFIRPSSESRLMKSKVVLSEKNSVESKMYNRLSHQLKEIQESIASIAQRRKKKPSKYKEKVITEVTEADPKHRIYKQVLNQIKEIKSNGYYREQPNPEPSLAKSASSSNSTQDPLEKILFYGVDYIEGNQFKIKIKLKDGKYYLYAKNSAAKVIFQMREKDYMKLHNSVLQGNPCRILQHLTIHNNSLQIKTMQRLPLQSLVKSHIDYY